MCRDPLLEMVLWSLLMLSETLWENLKSVELWYPKDTEQDNLVLVLFSLHDVK